ncbi:prmA [Symbiodinium necroappetens]|uniref:PrmA protein n=1 Tax=Symbiodinium necroappetens TaxID=1628268 RepID=A0A812J870_9DINO|nr:prmA [Symbiodinium necroappetens]
MEQGIVDLGAGNGILGIGALLLGAPRAVFVEVDPVAADAIEEGLEAQSLSARSRVLRCDVEEASIALAKTSVHMMHSAGAMHVEPWARDHGWRAVKWLDVEFPLPRKYAHQSRRRGFTSAAMWRICPEISMSKTESKSRRVLSDDLF